MVSSVIWVVIYARPEVPLRPLFDERTRVGADMMYMRRFGQAKAMSVGDRVVIHFGGPKRTDRYAQYLVQAGCVMERARPITQQDAQNLKTLLDLTCEMFPDFQRAPGLLERQGIIFYHLFSPPPGIGPLPRPYPQPKAGDNFIRLLPERPEYPQVDSWWRKVVPKSYCGND